MTTLKQLSRLISALVITFAISTAILPRPVVAQQAPKAAATTADYSAQLAAIEKAIDEKRIEFGIPGISMN